MSIVFQRLSQNHNTGQHIFCSKLKICYFEDFLVLKMIGIFIFLCKLGKTAKNEVKPAKKAILGTFEPPLPPRGAGRVKSKYRV